MYKVQAGKELHNLKFSRCIEKKRGKPSLLRNDDIMTFDIEASSAFITPSNEVVAYNKKYSSDFLSECKKTSIVYVWQFSINENVYMGRTLNDFYNFLELVEREELTKKIVYVHNLSYEFQFLRNIIRFDNVFAREKRKVMYFTYKSFEFRCSYFLTRLSLENWAIQKKLPVQKMVGDLDYNIIRTPNTILTDENVKYCIHDCLVIYEGIKQYKEKYEHVYKIPLTQTGEIRLELIKRMKNELKYRKRCTDLIPTTIEDYKRLIEIFHGGYTHANFLWANKIIENVKSKDEASAYPWVMISKKYPFTKFVKTEPNQKYFNNDKFSYIIEFECENIKSIKWNTFLSKSKCKKILGYELDNGRVLSANYIRISMTNIDYELFKKCYSFVNLKIINFYVSFNSYLSPIICKFIIELFENKTKLKDIKEQEALYMISKQFINAIFGMCVTREITDEIIFTNEWDKILLNENNFIEKTTSKKKNIRKNINAFQFGVWVTAYAGENLWKAILEIDKDVIYCDTDSVKYKGDYEYFFTQYNKNVQDAISKIAKRLNVSRETLTPTDIYGNVHCMGIFENDGVYSKFKTLGAKKYIYEDKDGILHMTVSGVRKKAVEQIKKIEEFEDGLEFDVEHAKKFLLHYNDEQEDIIFNKGKYDEYIGTDRHGITFQPTTYKLGMTLEYYALLYGTISGETEIFKNEE